MTAKYVWNELKKLVVIDHQITDAKKQIANHEASVAALKEPLAQLQEQKESLATSLKDIQKQLDHHELDVTAMKSEDQKKQKMLETLMHIKEIQALEKELTELEDKIDDTESAMVELMEQQEAAQAQFDQLDEKMSQAQAEFEAASSEAQNAIKSAQEQISEFEKQWEAQASNVPPELSKNYLQIRARVPNPVVPIISSSCSACFSALLGQDITALTKTTVIRCRGCYRFLFMPDEAAQAEVTAS